MIAVALAVAVAVAPVPVPLPVPTLKPLEPFVSQGYSVMAWQWIWPRTIVVGQCSDCLLTTTPEGWRELELRGSKMP